MFPSTAWSCAAVALALGCSAGCAVGTGDGAVDGALFIRQCAQRPTVVSSGSGSVYSFGAVGEPAPYSMSPTFFAAEPIDDFKRLYPMNRLNIRVQSDGARIEQADVLFLNIASVQPIAQMLGLPIAVTPNSNLRATLDLNQSCPSPEVTPTLEGEITFTKFGSAVPGGRVPTDFRISFDDPLEARFQFRVVDVRAASIGGTGSVSVEPAVGGDISGFFSFVVRQGQRAQAYP